MKQYLPLKITKPIVNVTSRIARYRIVVFVVVVAIIYGYIALTINMLSHAEPSGDQISGQMTPIKATKIDPKIIQQLLQLQDNSVSVQSLFTDTRNNPFQEN